jgi:hypothetical protein
MVRIYRCFATSWTRTAGIPPLECSVHFDELPVCVRDSAHAYVRGRVRVCGYVYAGVGLNIGIGAFNNFACLFQLNTEDTRQQTNSTLIHNFVNKQLRRSGVHTCSGTTSRASGCAIQRHTRTQHSVWASPKSCCARLHCMRVTGNTLEESCCRTCRRCCAKRRLRRLLAATDHASGLLRGTTLHADQRSPSTPPPTCHDASFIAKPRADPRIPGAGTRIAAQ